jgi:nitrile hydratase accessory protein
MLTRYEHYAVTEMLGASDTPPRANGALYFGHPWERQAFGVALALSKAGYFEWGAFRGNLIAAIEAWEQTHALDDPSWDYYECWLAALEKTILETGLVTSVDLGAALAAVGEAPPLESVGHRGGFHER